jgi:hypothetical protein
METQRKNPYSIYRLLGKPLTQRKSVRPNLARGGGLKDLSSNWKP